MLKIKDNVDLKELEKYGFDKWTRENCCNKYAYTYDCKGKSTIKLVVHLDKTIRIVNFNSEVVNLIYDLIKDALVEKVEE